MTAAECVIPGPHQFHVIPVWNDDRHVWGWATCDGVTTEPAPTPDNAVAQVSAALTRERVVEAFRPPDTCPACWQAVVRVPVSVDHDHTLMPHTDASPSSTPPHVG
jgi:hypothetical protein